MLRFAWALIAIGGLCAQDMKKCPDYARVMKLLEGQLRVQSSITINRRIYAPMEQIGVTLTLLNPLDRELQIPDPEESHHCGLIGMSRVIWNSKGFQESEPVTYYPDSHRRRLPGCG